MKQNKSFTSNLQFHRTHHPRITTQAIASTSPLQTAYTKGRGLLKVTQWVSNKLWKGLGAAESSGVCLDCSSAVNPAWEENLRFVYLMASISSVKTQIEQPLWCSVCSILLVNASVLTPRLQVSTFLSYIAAMKCTDPACSIKAS